jgi:hypothetical protein
MREKQIKLDIDTCFYIDSIGYIVFSKFCEIDVKC